MTVEISGAKEMENRYAVHAIREHETPDRRNESLMWFYRDAEVARLRTCAEISLDFGRFQRAIVDREEMELP